MDRIFIHHKALSRYFINEIARGRTTLDFTRGRWGADGPYRTIDYDTAAENTAYADWFAWFKDESGVNENNGHAAKFYADFEGDSSTDEPYQNRYGSDKFTLGGEV
ncbi:MAG: hypothetical protein QF535_20070 [Anaerolineales bacterium]|nr:hypothetical protein [Anaerolineales bacterium]